MKRKRIKKLILFIAIILLFSAAILGTALFIWLYSLKIPVPDLSERKVAESTKIYDRTGEIVLYDVYDEVRRTVIPFEQIPRNVKNATVAIEDDKFYQHSGISIVSIMRAVFADILSASFNQGGSTITQQLVKNALLTPEKTVTRKIKELALTIKIEKTYSKDEILALYLNEIPYGSNIYGIEAASQAFFGKGAEELTLAEAAYLASLPQAPSYYSPYGDRKQELENRKNLVLNRMAVLGFITEKEAKDVSDENPEFMPKASFASIKAPHFVLYVKDSLNRKYGEDVVARGGLKIITSLDWQLQAKAEDLVKQYAEENEEKFNAFNAGLTAIDPKTGQILVMVGSRDWHGDPLPEGCSPGIDCKFEPEVNVTNYGKGRQPGSSIKPFIYATAFKKGFRPDTAVFDLPVEFNPSCPPDGSQENGTNNNPCYHPGNYDGIFRGPITLREALAQSVNLPSVKTLYLAGLNDSLKTIKDFGITTLNEPGRYGLTLVLGGGEVKLTEMVSAYSVFANDGYRNPLISIIRVEDKNGRAIESLKAKGYQAIEPEIARMVSDVLSDNDARAPAFGEHSFLYFPEREVAVKTGTTNDYRDAWVIGYTPNFAMGVWAGNNDNSEMEKRVAGFIAAPLWNAFFKEVFKELPKEEFKKPQNQPTLGVKPVLKGEWRGNKTYLIDFISKKLATEFTPQELIQEKVITQIHSILYWINKDDITGPQPENPQQDPQFNNWEYSVRKWLESQNIKEESEENLPKEFDDIHKPEYAPLITIISPAEDAIFLPDEKITISLKLQSKFNIKQVDFFLSNKYLGSNTSPPFDKFSLNLSSVNNLAEKETLRITAYDEVRNSKTTERQITIKGTDAP